MRARNAVGLVVWLGGCAKAAPAPPPPEAPTPVASASSAAEEEPVELPTRPTPAFMPRENGTCSRAYKLVSETCVHRYYEQSRPGGMETALAAYKRGVASPMLGPVPTRAAAPAPKAPLDPGALTKRSEADAEKAREKRLADLDQMLEATRAKLRERDEAGKAKSVPNAPKSREAASTDPTQAAAGRVASAATSSGDPAAARLNELNQLAAQLSGDQLRSLMTDLSKTGVNIKALDDLLRQETAGGAGTLER
ncbi:MAG TPA: hypothetical protein VFZ61_34140 [Polyangiales bacterium]